MRVKFTLEFEATYEPAAAPNGRSESDVYKGCVDNLADMTLSESKNSKALYDALWERGFNVLWGDVKSLTITNTDT